MSRQQSSNLKANKQRLTTAWLVAVEAMETYGTEFLRPTDDPKVGGSGRKKGEVRALPIVTYAIYDSQAPGKPEQLLRALPLESSGRS